MLWGALGLGALERAARAVARRTRRGATKGPSARRAALWDSCGAVVGLGQGSAMCPVIAGRALFSVARDAFHVVHFPAPRHNLVPSPVHVFVHDVLCEGLASCLLLVVRVYPHPGPLLDVLAQRHFP